MFCTYCNCNVSKDTTLCPNCGNQLDDTTKSLNPKPQLVVDEGTPLLGEVITNTDTVQETVIGQPAIVAVDSSAEAVDVTTDESVTVQLTEDGVSSQHAETTTNQSKVYDFSSSVMQTSNTEMDAQFVDDNPVINTTAVPTEGKKVPVIFPIVLILTVIGIIVFIIFNKNPNQDREDVLKNITNTEITESTATAQDAVETTESLNDLNTEMVSEPVQSITFGETTVEPIAIESVQVTDTETIITKSVYEITADEARTYIDEQEVLYQLEDSSIQDVAYVKSAYRYHYVGYYQYGIYHGDSLLVFTITDDVAVDTSDNFAWEYFTEMGVE